MSRESVAAAFLASFPVQFCPLSASFDVFYYEMRLSLSRIKGLTRFSCLSLHSELCQVCLKTEPNRVDDVRLTTLWRQS